MKIQIIIASILASVVLVNADTWHIVTTNDQGVVTCVSYEQTPFSHTLGPNEYPADYAFPTNSYENWKKVGNDWLEMTPEDIQARYDAWQLAKPIELKVFENLYVTFLTNEWTGILRVYSLIDTNTTITVTNADTTVNVGYLMQLRAMDSAPNKPVYSYYKNEFSSFRDNLERIAGSNALPNVRWHQEIVPLKAYRKMLVDNAVNKVPSASKKGIATVGSLTVLFVIGAIYFIRRRFMGDSK